MDEDGARFRKYETKIWLFTILSHVNALVTNNSVNYIEYSKRPYCLTHDTLTYALT